MKIKTMAIVVAVYHENENPIFGEGVTHLKLEDEAGGGFLVLSQDGKELRLNLEELLLLAKEGKKLMKIYEKAQEQWLKPR